VNPVHESKMKGINFICEVVNHILMVDLKIRSKKRLKKLEEELHVERNKLELTVKTRVQEIKGAGQAEDGEIEQWDEELEQLTSKLRSLRTKSPQSDNAARLTLELRERDERIIELETALASFENELKAIGSDKTDAESKLESINQSHSEKITSLSTLIVERDDEISRLKEDLDLTLQKKEKTAQKGGAEAGTLKSIIAELEHSIEAKDSEIHSRENRISELQTTLKAMQEELQGIGKKRIEVMSESQRETAKKESEIRDLHYEIELKTGELDDLKTRLFESQTGLRDLEKARKKDAATWGKEKTGFDSEIRDGMRRLEKKTREVEGLRKDMGLRESELEMLVKEKKAVESAGKEARKRFESEAMDLKLEIKSRESEIKALKEKLESWHATIREELDSAIEYITNQSAEINSLKAELEARDARERDFNNRLNKPRYP